MPFSRHSLSTVVPLAFAIFDRLSPFLILTVAAFDFDLEDDEASALLEVLRLFAGE